MPNEWELVGSSRDGYATTEALEVGVPYQVAVVPRTKIGAKGNIDEASQTSVQTRGQFTQPTDVQNFVGTWSNDVFTLTWGCNPEPDIRGYQLRLVPSTTVWVGGRVIVDCIEGNVLAMPAPWIGQLRVGIKAVNTSGRQSDDFAAIALEAPAGSYVITTSATEEPGWTGTKVDTVLVGSTLELDTASALTGTYQTATLATPGGIVDTHRIYIALQTSIVPLAADAGRLAIGVWRPYWSRRDAGALGAEAWEGTENIDRWDASAWQSELADFYVDLPISEEPFKFEEGVQFLIEYRTATDGGTIFTDWFKFTPAVVSLNAIQVRVTLTSPHEDIVPRLATLTVALVRSQGGMPAHDFENHANVAISPAIAAGDVMLAGSASPTSFINVTPTSPGISSDGIQFAIGTPGIDTANLFNVSVTAPKIDFGTGVGQVDAELIPVIDIDGHFPTDNVEAALASTIVKTPGIDSHNTITSTAATRFLLQLLGNVAQSVPLLNLVAGASQTGDLLQLVNDIASVSIRVDKAGQLLFGSSTARSTLGTAGEITQNGTQVLASVRFNALFQVDGTQTVGANTVVALIGDSIDATPAFMHLRLFRSLGDAAATNTLVELNGDTGQASAQTYRTLGVVNTTVDHTVLVTEEVIDVAHPTIVRTVTLYNVTVTEAGKTVRVINSGDVAVSVVGSGGDTVQGETSVEFAAGDALTLLAKVGGWKIH